MTEYVPGLAGVPATKSAISSIDGEKGILAYRGYSIQDLVERSSFEETALLLMNGELPSPQELTNFKNILNVVMEEMGVKIEALDQMVKILE